MSGVGAAFRPQRRPSLIQRLSRRPRQHESDAKSYCARLYYSNSGTNSWEVYFAIMWNLELHIAAADSNYTNAAAKAGPSQVVMFEGDEIKLDIAAEGVVLENGWTITPYSHPVITKCQVDHFVPGGQVPSCQLYVKWTRQQEQPPQLVHRVKLLGAKEPNNFFLIRLPALQALENQPHYKVYQQALKEGVAIPLKYLKVLFFGPPRTGKTSMRRRLVGEIQNLAKEAVQASTGTAEHYDVIVKLVEDKISDKISTSTTVVTKSKWSTVKALFGKEKSIHETELDEELRLLYQFIYRVAPQIENRSPVTKEQSPAVQAKSPSTVESNPNTSFLHKVSSDMEAEYGLSAKQMEEIEKAFEAFDKVLHTAGEKQLKVLLDGTILMNMVDTGGQPAFVEMLPALTISPALYLIFFRLNQELNKRYQVQYVSEDQEDVQLGESSYTVEEVIFQALSSIGCFSCTTPKKANMPNPSHAAMLIGTHKDLLGSDPETVATKIKAKDDALQKSLVEILKTDLFNSDKNLLRYASDDQLIFAIDNTTGDEGELEKVRNRLENIIKQEFDDWPIPASWLMFSIFLRKMGKRTLSLLQCYEIGDRLNVKSTDEALWFLHHCVGMLMHFPEIEEIKDIVICDPQVVFDSVTELILNSFTFKKVSKSACDKFKETGQFSFKDIQKIEKNLKSDSLSLPNLVKLLEYLNIIAPIKSGGPLPSSSLPLSPGLHPQSDTYQEENVVYFMPAVLRHAKEEELHMKQSSTDPAPLMIRFKCGSVPVGVFCATIASLVAKMDTLRWTLLVPSYGHTLCKNKIIFRINGAYNLTLISKPKWYEIYIARISTEGWALEKMCRHVLETVCDTLDQVISKMRYKQYTISSPSDPTLYELGFKCPEHPSDDHLVINTPMSGEEVPQSAKSLWLNHHERKSVMICQDKGGKAIDLRDKRFSQSFADQSLVWFGEVAKTPSLLPGSVPGSQPPNPELKDLMHLQVSNWYRLGLSLGLNSHHLDVIKRDHQGDTESQTCKMFDRWLRTQPDASYEQLIKALRKVGDESVANFLSKEYAKCSLESFTKDDSKECSPSRSPKQPISSSSSSPRQWKLSASSGSHKRRHVPRSRQSRSRSRSPRHRSSSKHQAHSLKSPRQLHSRSLVHSRSPTSRSTSHSHSSKRRRSKSRSHKQRSKSRSPKRRSRSQSPPRKRSRSRSPRLSTRSRSPRSHRRRPHSQSPHQPSHSRSCASQSTFHSHSSKSKRSKCRSHSSCKQRSKSRSPKRSSQSQSPPRRRSRSCSPRHSSSSRHSSRSRSPKSHRRQPHFQNPHRRSRSRSRTSRNTSHSHRPKRRSKPKS